jgi:hypothetical protein
MKIPGYVMYVVLIWHIQLHRQFSLLDQIEDSLIGEQLRITKTRFQVSEYEMQRLLKVKVKILSLQVITKALPDCVNYWN